MPDAGLIGHRVYDPVLRALHAANALLVSLLAVSGLVAQALEPGALSAWLHAQHGVIGAALVVGLAGRGVWGLVGPPHARWRDLWHPAAWRALARGRRLFTPPARRGHHPAASLVYLGVYALLLALAASGLLLLAATAGHGPLAATFGWDAALTARWLDPHRYAGWAVTLFIGGHLAAMLLHAHVHRIPVAQGMLTGVQYLDMESK